MSSHHHVWLFSSIGTGHSSAPPGYSSLPIRLWFAGKSWKTKFLFPEVSRFLFYWKEPDFPFCLKRKPNCHFLLLSLAFDCKLVFLLLFQFNQIKAAKEFVIRKWEGWLRSLILNILQILNIATGETSPAIAPFHFFGNFNFFNFHYLIIFIT